MANNRKVGTAKSALVTALPRACSDELAAVEFMEAQRWGDAPFCPKCGVVGECYQMTDGKKGVSAKQIERQTGLTYKSALFMMHRIRWAMRPATEDDDRKLTGVVEFDETYVGGKPRRRSFRADGTTRLGPGWDFSKRKTPVVAGVERGGRVRARVVEKVTRQVLPQHVLNMVDTSAHLMTDERPSYKRVGRQFAQHDRVHHKSGEYVRGNVTTNRIEGFFAGLKRQ